MRKRLQRFRQTGAHPSKLSVALTLSLAFHVALFVIPISLVYMFKREAPNVFRVQLVQGAEYGALRPDQSAPNPVQGVRPEDAPIAKGTPDANPGGKPPEEKKPEPPKPEEKKPEPPKPKEEEKKPEEKKPEPPKPKVEEKKPEKKEPEKKETAKKEEKKEPEKKETAKKEEKKEPEKKETAKKEETKEPAKKETAKKETAKEPAKKEPAKKPVVLDEADSSPLDDAMEEMAQLDSVGTGTGGPLGMEDGLEGIEEVHYAKNVGELTQGSAVEAADFPTALSYWATLVKRKVDRAWKNKVPAGITLDSPEMVVRVGFWVNRSGELIENPIVLDGAIDPGLRMSCIQAIKDSIPLPPFPDGFNEAEQYITYVFTLTR